MQPDPSLKQFMEEVGRHPILSRAETTQLVILAQAGNIAAARKVCAANIRFVVRVAGKFRGSGMPMEDMVNDGATGLMKAVYRFDPSKRLHFLSYAVWWIRQSILLAIRDKAKTIRTSTEHAAPLRRLKKAPLKQIIGGAYMEDLQAESARSGIRPEFLAASLAASYGGLSLDQPFTEDGATPAEIIPCDSPPPDAMTQQREYVDILNRLRGKLNPQQREVITRYYGLDGGVPMTLNAVGTQMNLTRQRIEQIKAEALRVMRIYSRKYTRE